MIKKTVLMLGDSLTQGNDWGRAFPACRMVNLGLGGDTCAGLWGRLDEAAASEPDLIFLMIGTNDFLKGFLAEEILEGHRRIWKELGQKSPKARLHVQAMPPYMEEALPGLAPNLDIMAANRLLAEEAENYGLPFIDVFYALADADRQLPAEYTSDGVHLTAPAYRIWEDLLRPFIERSGALD